MTVDLVGPKGYKHGYIYVGGPGLPSSPPARSHHGGSGGRHRRSATPGYSTKHEGMGTHGVYRDSDGKRIGGVSSIGGGVHYAYRDDMSGTTQHGSLTDAVRHMAQQDRLRQHTQAAAGATPTHRIRGVDLGGHDPESAEGRRRALAAGHALPPSKPGGKPSYPVTDAKHWEKARDAVGRTGGGAKRRALAKLLAKTAPEFGKSIKGTWIEQDLGGAKTMSNLTANRVLDFADAFIPNPTKAQWAAIDAKRGGGGDEAGADKHIGAAKASFTMGRHSEALNHLQTAHAMTSDPAKKAQIESLHKNLAGTALQAGTIRAVAMSNGRRTVEYDLAARVQALRDGGVLDFADGAGNEGNAHNEESHTCPRCGHVFYETGGYSSQDAMPPQGKGTASGTNLQAMDANLRTPANAATRDGFNPASAGLNVRGAPSGSYASHAHSNGAGRGIELARRQVTSASDIVVSRGEGGQAIIRHRRGGDEIGTIARLASGQWGGQIAGGTELTPHTHQRGALQELIGTWNKGQVSPFRPAMPIQQAPVTPPLMAQLGVSNVRLATPATGAQSGPRVTGFASDGDGDSDSGSDGGSGPAGLTPKGVTIYKKLIAKGLPPARALAFARNSEKASSGSFKKAS